MGRQFGGVGLFMEDPGLAVAGDGDDGEGFRPVGPLEEPDSR